MCFKFVSIAYVFQIRFNRFDTAGADICRENMSYNGYINIRL